MVRNPETFLRPAAHGRGLALVQSIFATIVLLAFTTLAVDIGQYFTARCELQRAADAAALAGVDCLSDDDPTAAVTAAATYAQANSISGKLLTAAAVRVTVGHYAGGQFQANVRPYNAMSVHLERSAAYNSQLPTYFGSVFGLNGLDVRVTAVARTGAAAEYKLVGLNGVSFGSVAGVLATVHGRLVSNGNINIGTPLGIGVSVDSDVRSCAGVVTRGPMATVSGSVSPLIDPLDYPSVTLPTANDNAKLGGGIGSSGDVTVIGVMYVPPGTYVVRNLTLLATAAVDLSGPVTFYVTGTFNVAGTCTLLGNNVFSAANLKIRVLPGGQVLFLASLLSPINMDLYAPDTDITIAVTVAAYKGRLVGRTLNIAVPVLSVFTEDRTLGSALPPGRQTALVG